MWRRNLSRPNDSTAAANSRLMGSPIMRYSKHHAPRPEKFYLAAGGGWRTEFFHLFFTRLISSPVFQTNGERKPSPILMGEGRVRADSILRQRRHICLNGRNLSCAPGWRSSMPERDQTDNTGNGDERTN
jgi:hypothetical protein